MVDWRDHHNPAEIERAWLLQDEKAERHRRRTRDLWIDRFAYLGAAASLLFLAALVLSGCGLRPDGSYAPETLISADTPCGHVDYHSTKDQANPAYQCTIGRDGEKSLTVGSDNAVGAGLIAQSVANGVVSGLAIVKAP